MAVESQNNIVKSIFAGGARKEKVSSLFGPQPHSSQVRAPSQDEVLPEKGMFSWSHRNFKKLKFRFPAVPPLAEQNAGDKIGLENSDVTPVLALRSKATGPEGKIAPREARPILQTWFNKSSPVGLDIGAHAIKMAQISREQHKVKLSHLILEEWPAPLLKNPSRDPQVLKEFLKDVLRKYNVRGPVYINAGQGTVHMKNIQLPQIPLGEVEQAVRWEMKQTYAQEGGGFSFDYVVLNKGEGSYTENVEVMTMSASKKDLLGRVELLESFGLKVLAIEPEVFSLLAALLFNQAIGLKEIVLLLDIGAGSTSLSIVRNREICFTRLLNFPGHALAGMAKEAVLSELDSLVSAIEHTFKYYSYQLMKSQITQFHKVILAGGGAKFPLLFSFLEDRLKVPIEMANPLADFGIIKTSNLGKEALAENAPRLGVAIGLALRAVEE